MSACPSCGAEHVEPARFCSACGAELGVSVQERRRPATMLFCDMSGSTALGERVDAEAVRAVMFRYFHTMRGAIERHGGTVEKFVGDAVMAVFGVPTAHEDDALRAVRAAWEMQSRLEELNEELARGVGVQIALRIGVNSGEVVAGDASSRQTIVTGDAVNVAARLEQHAGPGEVLLGEATYRLVRGAVEAERAEPIAAKGKSAPVAAYRLLSVATTPAGRRFAHTLVGRVDELAALQRAQAEAESGRCNFVLVVGEPGVGKSRLAAEVLSGRRVFAGRCLPYGEGITYWPLAEIVRAAAGIRDDDSAEAAQRKIGRLAGTNEPALSQALGLAGGAAGPKEIALAFRRLLALLAEQGPLCVLLDDLHWAEDPLLDLIEDVRDRAQAPIFVLGVARPELLERRQWEALALQPLEGGDASGLVEHLLESEQLDPELRARVLEASGGNPLFAEELVAMLAEGDASPEAMPPTLDALLAARLDLLPPTERAVAECGAVEGQVFHRGSVESLCEDAATVPSSLDGLSTKELVQPAQAAFAGEAAFSFRHILIRDAAYNGTAKRVRASLHERFAAWLERAAGDRLAEVEEIVGHHLEQAYRFRIELEPVGEATREIAERAATSLASAGRRAADRSDVGAASRLLERALELAQPEQRPALLLDLGLVISKAGDGVRASSILQDARSEASLMGTRAVELVATVELAMLASDQGVESANSELLRVALAAADELELLGDDRSLALVLSRAGVAQGGLGRFGDAVQAIERGIQAARRARAALPEAELLEWLTLIMTEGPTPVAEERELLLRELERFRDVPGVEWFLLIALGQVTALEGDIEPARRLLAQARELALDLGLELNAMAIGLQLGQSELYAGDLARAETAFRDAYVAVIRLGAPAFAATLGGYLAESLFRQGRLDEIGGLLDAAEGFASDDDFQAQVVVSQLRAKLLARTGEPARALPLAEAAVEMADASDSPYIRASTRLDLAEVLERLNRPADAERRLREARAVYEAKGATAGVRQVDERLYSMQRAPRSVR